MGNQTGWTKREVESFQSAIIQWFEQEGRHELPWRQTRDPYAVLVSELMLQQTQVNTVLKRGFFENWLEKFPDVSALAAAEEDEVLKAWEGLGYYNRARNLQKTAIKIVEAHGGRFPTSMDEILALPGVGRYTAGAVQSFAFEKSAPVVDGNVVRIFSRIFGYTEPVDTTGGLKQMWNWAEALVPCREASAYNSGLMEIGQRICRKSAPACGECPLRKHCAAFKTQMSIESLPVKKNRQRIENRFESVVFFGGNERVFLTREAGNRRKGLWRLPEFDPKQALKWPKILQTQYSITKYRVELSVHRGNPTEIDRLGLDGEWFAIPGETDQCAMAAPYRRALERVIAEGGPANG